MKILHDIIVEQAASASSDDNKRVTTPRMVDIKRTYLRHTYP